MKTPNPLPLIIAWTALIVYAACSCNTVKKNYSKSSETKDSVFSHVKDSVGKVINTKTQVNEETNQQTDQAVIILDSTGSTVVIESGKIEKSGTTIKVTGPAKVNLKRDAQSNKKDSIAQYFQSSGQKHDSLSGQVRNEKKVIEKQKQSLRMPVGLTIALPMTVLLFAIAALFLWWVNKKFGIFKKEADGNS